MKRYILVSFLFCCIQSVFSQQFENETYNWSSDPKPYSQLELDKSVNEIGLKDMRIVEIGMQGEIATQLTVLHTIKVVNSNEAIERNNKISVPYSSGSKILQSKVRVIQPNGKIIELDSSDIQEAQDETTKRKYKYFAVRGLLQGAILEQLFIKKSIPNLSGTTYIMQFAYTSRNSSFELIYPSNLVIDTKSYGNYPTFKTDTSIVGKIRKYIEPTVVNALARENYSNYNRYVQRVSFKLTGNISTGRMSLYSFDKWGENIYYTLNAPPQKKEYKVLDKYLESSGIIEAKTEEDKIRCLESFIKKDKFISDEVENEKVDLASLIKTKVLGKFEMTRLFCALLNYVGIKHQIVVTNDRFDEPFDPAFENYVHLQDFVIYFPDEDKYLAPTEIFLRYPLLPSGWISNYALFIKPVQLTNGSMGVVENRMIMPLDYTYSIDTMDISVDMTKEMSTASYHYRLVYTGYSASSFQPIFDFIPQEEKDKARKDIIANYIGESDNIKLSTENEGVEFLGKKPFIVNADIVTSKLTEKAGDQYLFKVGESIGRQVQMYQEGTRTLPLELEYCHAYVRNINVTIPAGYKVSNLDKLNMSFIVMHDEKEVAAFTSLYNLDGNTLKIRNLEYYNAIHLPINQYEDFKNVVNAAADFNKIVLVLEKK